MSDTESKPQSVATFGRGDNAELTEKFIKSFLTMIMAGRVVRVVGRFKYSPEIACNVPLDDLVVHQSLMRAWCKTYSQKPTRYDCPTPTTSYMEDE